MRIVKIDAVNSLCANSKTMVSDICNPLSENIAFNLNSDMQQVNCSVDCKALLLASPCLCDIGPIKIIKKCVNLTLMPTNF